MYVKAFVVLENDAGVEETYEVGADVECQPGNACFADSYDVGEPDISAPDCTLRTSRLAGDPQGADKLEGFGTGWSALVEDALIEAYQAKCEDPY
jgi:hypothetical protein